MPHRSGDGKLLLKRKLTETIVFSTSQIITRLQNNLMEQ